MGDRFETKPLSDKEEMIVKATQHLAGIHSDFGYVPDYECVHNKFSLSPEEMRAIRDLVQSIK